MPIVRMTVSVGCEDLPSRPGEEVRLSPERAQQVVRAGWGEIVRERAPETPEGRARDPETAVRRTRQRRKPAAD